MGPQLPNYHPEGLSLRLANHAFSLWIICTWLWNSGRICQAKLEKIFLDPQWCGLSFASCFQIPFRFYVFRNRFAPWNTGYCFIRHWVKRSFLMRIIVTSLADRHQRWYWSCFDWRIGLICSYDCLHSSRRLVCYFLGESDDWTYRNRTYFFEGCCLRNDTVWFWRLKCRGFDSHWNYCRVLMMREMAFVVMEYGIEDDWLSWWRVFGLDL